MEMPIPSDWDGETYCKYEVCWPDSTNWKAILRGLVTEPARGWFWDANSGNLLETLSKFRATMVNNIELREVILSCNDEQFERLIAALNAINLSVSVSGGGGCCPDGGGGIQPPAQPGTEGETPPPGFEEPTDSEGNPIAPGSLPYQTRKCKVANLIHFQNVAIIDKIIASDFLTWTAETYGFALTQLQLIALSYLLGELATPWPIVDGLLAVIVGWSSGLLSELLGETDMDELKLALEDNEQELVCAIYNSQSAIQATNDYLQVLADNGVSIGNRQVMLAIMVPKLVNLAFFRDAQKEAIEDAITNFVGPVDCDLCGGCDDANDVIFDFVDSITGWTLQPGVTFSDANYNTLVGAGVLSWNEPNESIQLAMGSGTPNSRMTAIVPISHTIQEGDGFYCQTQVAVGTITFNWFLAENDGTVIVAGGFGTGGNTTQARDLTEFAGVEVGYIGLWAAKAQNTSFELNVPYVRISCEAP